MRWLFPSSGMESASSLGGVGDHTKQKVSFQQDAIWNGDHFVSRTDDVGLRFIRSV